MLGREGLRDGVTVREGLDGGLLTYDGDKQMTRLWNLYACGGI